MNTNTNLKKLFNNTILDFYVYKNITNVQFSHKFELKNLPKKILWPKTLIEKYNKKNAPVFLLNNLINNYRSSKNIKMSNVCYIDIDFKSEQQKNDFIKQYKNYNNNLEFEENVENFKKDMSTIAWITATSFSGAGVRCIFLVFNYIGKTIIDECIDVPYTPNEIHKSNIDYVNDLMLNLTGVIPNDDSNKIICQTTYPLIKENSYITDIYHKKEFKFKLKIKKYEINKDVDNTITITPDEVNIKLNNISKDLHYDDILPILSALQLNKEYRLPFYNFIKQNYKGQSFTKKLKTFESFNNFIDNLSLEYNVSLKYILNIFNIFKQNYDENLTDLYGKKFDKIIKVDKYIKNFEFNEKNVVVNAGTGMGKTTASLNYLSKLKGVKIFCCPQNLIADQTAIKMDELNIKYHKFYNGDYCNVFDSNALILTNLANIEKLNDYNLTIKCIVFDECHKHTDWAIFDENKKIKNKQILIPESDQIINISATPENFIFNEDIYYVKYINDDIKRKIYIQNYKSKITQINKIINFINVNKDKNILIFNNDKNYNKKIKERIFDKIGIEVGLLDADNKDGEYMNIAKNNTITGINICTSLIAEGNNINNIVDYVFILDNETQMPQDIYQFSNRFRNCSPCIFLLRMSKFNDDKDWRSKNIHEELKIIYDKKIKELENDLNIINNIEDIPEKIKSNITLNYIYKIGDKYYINNNEVKQYTINILKNDILKSRFDFYYFLMYYFKINVKKEDKTKNDNEKIDKKDIIVFFKKYKKYDWNQLIQNIEDNDLIIFENYKKTIKLYYSRLYKLTIYKNIDIDEDKVFSNFKIFNNYLKKIEILNSKLIKEQNMLNDKIETAFLNDYDKFKKIINENPTFEFFQNEYVKLNLLSENITDINNIKKINTMLSKYNIKFISKISKKDGKPIRTYHGIIN